MPATITKAGGRAIEAEQRLQARAMSAKLRELEMLRMYPVQAALSGIQPWVSPMLYLASTQQDPAVPDMYKQATRLEEIGRWLAKEAAPSMLTKVIKGVRPLPAPKSVATAATLRRPSVKPAGPPMLPPGGPAVPPASRPDPFKAVTVPREAPPPSFSETPSRTQAALQQHTPVSVLPPSRGTPSIAAPPFHAAVQQRTYPGMPSPAGVPSVASPAEMSALGQGVPLSAAPTVKRAPWAAYTPSDPQVNISTVSSQRPQVVGPATSSGTLLSRQTTEMLPHGPTGTLGMQPLAQSRLPQVVPGGGPVEQMPAAIAPQQYTVMSATTRGPAVVPPQQSTRRVSQTELNRQRAAQAAATVVSPRTVRLGRVPTPVSKADIPAGYTRGRAGNLVQAPQRGTLNELWLHTPTVTPPNQVGRVGVASVPWVKQAAGRVGGLLRRTLPGRPFGVLPKANVKTNIWSPTPSVTPAAAAALPRPPRRLPKPSAPDPKTFVRLPPPKAPPTVVSMPSTASPAAKPTMVLPEGSPSERAATQMLPTTKGRTSKPSSMQQEAAKGWAAWDSAGHGTPVPGTFAAEARAGQPSLTNAPTRLQVSSSALPKPRPPSAQTMTLAHPPSAGPATPFVQPPSVASAIPPTYSSTPAWPAMVTPPGSPWQYHAGPLPSVKPARELHELKLVGANAQTGYRKPAVVPPPPQRPVAPEAVRPAIVTPAQQNNLAKGLPADAPAFSAQTPIEPSPWTQHTPSPAAPEVVPPAEVAKPATEKKPGFFSRVGRGLGTAAGLGLGGVGIGAGLLGMGALKFLSGGHGGHENMGYGMAPPGYGYPTPMSMSM